MVTSAGSEIEITGKGGGRGRAPTSGIPSQDIAWKKSDTDRVKVSTCPDIEPFWVSKGFLCQL